MPLNKTVHFSLLTMLTTVFLLATPLHARPAQAKEKRTLAVFPFKVLNKDPRAMHLGEGASEHIITHLVQSKTIEVVEESQLDKALKQVAKGQSGMFEESSAIELGRMVNAKYIIIGTVQLFGFEASLNARLLDVTTAKLVMATSVQGKWQNIFDLYERLAVKVTNSLRQELGYKMISDATPAPAQAPKVQDKAAPAQVTQKAAPKVAPKIKNGDVSEPSLVEQGEKFDPAFGGHNLIKATKLYRRAVLSNAQDPHARRRLASTLMAMQRWDEARYNLQKSLALDPQNAWAEQQLGYCLHKLDREAEAVDHYKKVLVMKPHDPKTLSWLGGAYLSLGKNAKAKKVFRAVLKKDPKNQLAKRGLRVAQQRIKSAKK